MFSKVAKSGAAGHAITQPRRGFHNPSHSVQNGDGYSCTMGIVGSALFLHANFYNPRNCNLEPKSTSDLSQLKVPPSSALLAGFQPECAPRTSFSDSLVNPATYSSSADIRMETPFSRYRRSHGPRIVPICTWMTADQITIHPSRKN